MELKITTGKEGFEITIKGTIEEQRIFVELIKNKFDSQVPTVCPIPTISGVNYHKVE